jgi:thymidylate synthase (FAD)
MEKNMKVKLISYSQPVEDLSEEGIDDIQELVAFCARVSNPTNQMNTSSSEKLIKYLVNNAHWSPLEMVSACMEIVTTRDIARQILRHRSFSFQEFSQRYADPALMGDQFVLREARLQDTKNRQNSIEIDLNTDEGRQLAYGWEQMQNRVITEANNAYQWAISKGIAKEQARAVLPEGNTISRMYMNGTIRSWIHYIDLRSANGTQLEHIEIAREIGKAIAKIFPLADEFTN